MERHAKHRPHNNNTAKLQMKNAKQNLINRAAMQQINDKLFLKIIDKYLK